MVKTGVGQSSRRHYEISSLAVPSGPAMSSLMRGNSLSSILPQNSSLRLTRANWKLEGTQRQGRCRSTIEKTEDASRPRELCGTKLVIAQVNMGPCFCVLWFQDESFHFL